jgi:hypothetical protein
LTARKPSLVEAAASDDRLAALRQLRDLLARQLASCDSNRDVASLSARLMEALAQIEELMPAPVKKGTVLDEIADRRRARGAAAKSVPGAERAGSQGRG